MDQHTLYINEVGFYEGYNGKLDRYLMGNPAYLAGWCRGRISRKLHGDDTDWRSIIMREVRHRGTLQNGFPVVRYYG